MAKLTGKCGAAALVVFSLAFVARAGDPETSPVIRTGYHLTARPWRPLGVPRDRYLDAIEGVCRFSIRHQNGEGAIIDPFLHREHQYATPYFAAAVATLVSAGRARDLIPHGVRAMDHATSCFAGGQAAIPDQHGNFFIAALTEALEAWRGHVADEIWRVWEERLKKPRREVISDGTNNWETYTMKGEWMRVRAGLAGREDAVRAIEESWRLRQRARFADAPWRLYHDRTSDPDTLSVEAVGRGNLLALVAMGYDGPSAREMAEWTEAATALSLLLQDPSGQVPANGRTDDHVWVDVGYQLAFEAMAERMRTRDPWLAGQYRRAAMLSFDGVQRWCRTGGEWAGSYFVTKNHFDPALRVGYQQASQYSNYNGSLVFHMAEAWRARQTEVVEHPAPTEIGGYTVNMDGQFATAFANAGGMQLQVNLRGQVAESHGNFWTPLGAVRFARPGWDSRIGRADGALTQTGGVSFAPALAENGRWQRLASLSSRYEGRWEAGFVHPLLVRCAVTWWPKPTQAGPIFRTEFTLTPDGILAVTRKASPGSLVWGVTWPLLENDGSPLETAVKAGIAVTGYTGSPDRENFIAVNAADTHIVPEPVIRGSYGDVRPLRVTTAAEENPTFIYPSGAGDPDAETVQKSLTLTSDGFRSVLGRVAGRLYAGRTSAGGFGDRLDLDQDGKPEVTFSEPCGFVLQLANGRITAVESDRAVAAEIHGRKLRLAPYSVAH
jgi:hypothetical protein